MHTDGECGPVGPDRADGDLAIQDDPALLADGWVRRHMAGPDRAQEAMVLYARLGYEVISRRLAESDLAPACRGCAGVTGCEFVVIYTRKKDAPRAVPGPGRGRGKPHADTDVHRDSNP